MCKCTGTENKKKNDDNGLQKVHQHTVDVRTILYKQRDKFETEHGTFFSQEAISEVMDYSWWV